VVAVADARNFSLTAARCNISQPTFSRQVAAVEKTLGSRFFECCTRKVPVTNAGHLFVREARRILQQSSRTASVLQAFSERQVRPVVVGVSILTDFPRLHVLVEESRRASSGASLEIHAAYMPEPMLGLFRGEVELAVVDSPTQARGVRFQPLAKERLVAALPEMPTASKFPTISPAELTRVPLVLLTRNIDPGRVVIDRVLSSAGVRPSRFARSETSQTCSTRSP
jgi:DNA-binding transcriptional LysR family regulator